MHKLELLEFKEVSDIIKSYYKAPADIFEYIEAKAKEIHKDEV